MMEMEMRPEYCGKGGIGGKLVLASWAATSVARAIDVPYESIDHSLLRPLLSLDSPCFCDDLEDLFLPAPLSSDTRLETVACDEDGSSSGSSPPESELAFWRGLVNSRSSSEGGVRLAGRNPTVPAVGEPSPPSSLVRRLAGRAVPSSLSIAPRFLLLA